MAVTIHVDPLHASATHAHHEESSLHYMARESRLVLRWVVAIAAAATVATMIAFFPWAILPAIVLLISYGMLLFANAMERRTQHPGDPSSDDKTLEAIDAATASADPAKIEKQVIAHEVHHRSFKTILWIVGSVAVLALIVAGIVLGKEMLFIGVLALFAYMLLVAAPLWLGWVEDEAEEEQHRVEDQLHDHAPVSGAGLPRVGAQ